MGRTYNSQLNRSGDEIASNRDNGDGTTTVTYKDGQTQVITGNLYTDETSPGIMTFDELSEDMKEYYNNNPEAKAEFDLVGKQGVEAQQKYMLEAAKAMLEYKKQKEYTEGQNKRTAEMKSIQDAADLRR